MPSPALTPDKLIVNANILTVDSHNPRAEALAIKNGKFVAVGANKDVEHLAGTGTKVINLSGKTVVPGFIDAHIHVMSTGCQTRVPDGGLRTAEHRACPGRAEAQGKGDSAWRMGPGLQVRRHQNPRGPDAEPLGVGRGEPGPPGDSDAPRGAEELGQ